MAKILIYDKWVKRKRYNDPTWEKEGDPSLNTTHHELFGVLIFMPIIVIYRLVIGMDF